MFERYARQCTAPVRPGLGLWLTQYLRRASLATRNSGRGGSCGDDVPVWHRDSTRQPYLRTPLCPSKDAVRDTPYRHPCLIPVTPAPEPGSSFFPLLRKGSGIPDQVRDDEKSVRRRKSGWPRRTPGFGCHVPLDHRHPLRRGLAPSRVPECQPVGRDIADFECGGGLGGEGGCEEGNKSCKMPYLEPPDGQ